MPDVRKNHSTPKVEENDLCEISIWAGSHQELIRRILKHQRAFYYSALSDLPYGRGRYNIVRLCENVLKEAHPDLPISWRDMYSRRLAKQMLELSIWQRIKQQKYSKNSLKKVKRKHSKKGAVLDGLSPEVKNEIEQISKVRKNKAQARQKIMDLLIRKGFTRQKAAGISQKLLNYKTIKARPIKKELQFELEESKNEKIFMPAEIDQLTGNWQEKQALVKVRHQQQKFRQMVLEAYNYTCAVTGTNDERSLEAAHIRPYQGPLSNDVRNGICMRADIHRLYDAGLIDISGDYKIWVDKSVKDRRYSVLDGQTLRLPRSRENWPVL